MSASLPPGRTGNRLLDRLPEEEYEMLRPSWEAVALPHGHEIYRSHGPMPYVYFPTKGLCSAVVRMEQGNGTETGAIGNEGMIGIWVYLGLDFSPFHSVSQVSGEALRLTAGRFAQAVRPGSALERLLRRYTAFSLRHAGQSAACNALHSVEERLSKWLLTAQDAAGQNEFAMTQEYLAEMLGVRRQTVTVLAGTLQRAGLIRYRRGILQVLDREGLADVSCECYGIAKAVYDRILA